MSVVKHGVVVRLSYTGTLDDGEVFDTTEDAEPVALRIGSGEVLPAFEAALLGMAPGGRRSFVLRPDEAYGERDEARRRDLPLSSLPHETTPKLGDILGVSADGSAFAPVTVLAVGDGRVEVDLNHPLAGRALHYDVEVIDVVERSGEAGTQLHGQP